jgi:hypothetical protein
MSNKPKILLDTKSKKQADKMHDGKEIGAEMAADPDAAIVSAGNKLFNKSNAMETKNTARNQSEDNTKQLTKDLNDLEAEWNDLYVTAGSEAERVYPDDDNKWSGYGFDLADTELSTRKKPPKVTGLQVTQGDAQGEADLVWDPQEPKTIDGYYLQINTVDPNDQSKWLSAKPISVSASKATIVQLTQGVKYWVRVIAFVGQTEGDPGDEKDVIAP